jgi:MFS family permease
MRIRPQTRILLHGSNLWYLGEGMLGPLFAIFAQKIGTNVLDIAWAWATYLIVSGFFIMYIGKLSDTALSKERLMIYGYFLNAFFTFTYLFVDKPFELFFVQMGLGVAMALATPTWNSLYARYEDKKHDGYEWGLAGGEAQIVTGIAVLIGGLLVTAYSFTVLFVVMGCIQLWAALYISQLYRKS